MSKVKQAYAKYKKFKDPCDKFQEYFDLANRLLDEDKRDAAIYEQSFKALMSAGEKILGRSISSHPYFKYHEQHFKVLWSTVEARSTVDNARASLDKAVKIVAQVRNEAYGIKKYYREYNNLHDKIASKLRGEPYGWHAYVKSLRRQRFSGMSKEDVAQECYDVMELVTKMLYTVSPEVKRIRQIANQVLLEYAAVVGYGRMIHSLMGDYLKKVHGLINSGKTVNVVLGRGEIRRRQWEQAKGLGISGGSRKTKDRRDPTHAAGEAIKVARRCASDWTDFGERSKTLSILMVNIPGGGEFPWDLARRQGIRVPGFEY